MQICLCIQQISRKISLSLLTRSLAWFSVFTRHLEQGEDNGHRLNKRSCVRSTEGPSMLDSTSWMDNSTPQSLIQAQLQTRSSSWSRPKLASEILHRVSDLSGQKMPKNAPKDTINSVWNFAVGNIISKQSLIPAYLQLRSSSWSRPRSTSTSTRTPRTGCKYAGTSLE